MVPRYSNKAISHCYNAVILWSNFIYMVPPTIAYQGVATRNQTLLREAVTQITLYRDIFQDRSTGIWRHNSGSVTDAGAWGTGNGWTLGGIACVLGTIEYWPTSASWAKEQQSLTQYAKVIVDGAIKVGPDSRTGLLRNYISTASSLPEAAGAAMIAANIYRLAELAPGTFAQSQYLCRADAGRAAVVKAVGSNGVMTPVVNPYRYGDNAPYGQNSPEAQILACCCMRRTGIASVLGIAKFEYVKIRFLSTGSECGFVKLVVLPHIMHIRAISAATQMLSCRS